MILTVTLNPALDITYNVDRLEANKTHRVTSVHKRAGGKGVNVGRVLAALGHNVVTTGLVGGETGNRILTDLTSASIATEFEQIEGESRQTVSVVGHQDRSTTLFNEPGPFVSVPEWIGFKSRFEQLLGEFRVVVLSGSIPPGLPDTAYAALVTNARSDGVITIVDTEGEPLRAAAMAGADVLKPNVRELEATTGLSDPTAGAAALRKAGASAVIVSRGSAGLVAVVIDGAWRAVPPTQTGNPTGAGDACVAGIAAGLALDQPWPEILRHTAALSAAAVLDPYAGGYDQSAYMHLLNQIHLEELDAIGASE